MVPVLLALLVLLLPPVEVPPEAYPSTQLQAALPWTQYTPSTTRCTPSPTQDMYWTHCQDTSYPAGQMSCAWVYADAGSAVLANWDVACSMYGGKADPPFRCWVTIWVDRSTYDCTSPTIPGIPGAHWWGST